MIYDKLYKWQQNIIQKFKYRNSLGLFLDMGLGKTPISLGFAEYKNCQKVLVVTINSKAMETKDVDGSWLNWASQSTMEYELQNKWSDKFNKDNSIFIINYESLFSRKANVRSSISLSDKVNNFIDSCRNRNVALIIDESHKMKDMQSKQTKAIFEIRKRLQQTSGHLDTLLLTGTPFTTGYIDLYTQLKMLGYDETKGHFTDMYCIKGSIPGLYEWQQPIVGYKNVEQLYELIHKYAVTIKSEDMVDLPEKIFSYHRLPTSHSFECFVNEKMKGKEIMNESITHKLQLKDLEKYNVDKKVNNPFFRNIAYPNLKWFAETNGTFWLRARQLSIGFQGNAEEDEWFDKSRINAIKTFLEEHEDNYILFYNYTTELRALFEVCYDLGYNIDVFCGEYKSLAFYEQYCKQTPEEKLVNKKNIILANFASGSTGMNWQEYNKCIISSLPVYKDYAQALKRIHRLGQKETCIYHIFYQMNWLDINMKKALDEQTDYTIKMFEADLNIETIKD